MKFKIGDKVRFKEDFDFDPVQDRIDDIHRERIGKIYKIVNIRMDKYIVINSYAKSGFGFRKERFEKVGIELPKHLFEI